MIGAAPASAAPQAADRDLPGKPAVFATCRDYGRSVRTRRFRYSEFTGEDGDIVTRELYDYEEDPFQSRNLAGKAVYRDRERELADTLHRHARRVSSLRERAGRDGAEP